MSFKVSEIHRIKKGDMASTKDQGNNGIFCIRKDINITIFVVASDCDGWDHLSVTINPEFNRCPTWEEMTFIKDKFWSCDDTVIQFHPKSSEYVNKHKYCLHLWKNQSKDIQLPPVTLV